MCQLIEFDDSICCKCEKHITVANKTDHDLCYYCLEKEGIKHDESGN